jgi:hypothetical protein
LVVVTRYDLTALGWLQFEFVCTELLAADGVAPEAWLGEADTTRWATISAHSAQALAGRPVAGPTVACVVWFPRWATTNWDARNRLAEALGGGIEAEPGGSVIVLTNAIGNADLCSLASEHLPGEADIVVLGRAELGRLIDDRADLWLRVPAVLGVRGLDDLVGADAGRDSTFDLGAARALAPTFVATGAYQRCCDVVGRHRFAVLSGPPEMGKTAAARMLGLVRLCQGWEVCECTDPDALWRAYRRDGRQMFIADDAFGSTEYRADAAERWALDLDRILQHLDDRHVLVWTSRPAPLHAALRRIHRENGLQRFPRPGEVMVDATDLTDGEKALMLFRHAVAAGLGAGPRRVIRAQAANIVSDPYLTPERIRRLVAGRLAELEGDAPGGAEIAESIAFEIGSPTDAMAASLAALDADHRDILVAMLDAPPGPVPERDLAAAVRRHRHELAQPVAALVDRLEDHFLRRVPPTAVTWVHPSWRDLVIEQLGHDPVGRCGFLGRCGVEGALLALSVRGGSAGERHLPLLAGDADWDALLGHAGALVADLGLADRVRILRQVSAAVHDRKRVDDRHAVAELDALAGRLLERILPADLDPAGLVLLQEWYGLAALVHAAPPAPDVARLWIELVPTTGLNLASPSGVAALESWTALIDILRQYDPAALERFGVPAALSGLVGELFAVDARVLAGKVARDEAMALRRVARSLAGVFPDQRTALLVFSTDVFAFSHPPEEDEIEERPRVFTDPPRPTIVTRVLADLAEPSPRRFLRRRRP